MIHSKPQSGNIFAFCLFLVIAFTLIAVNLLSLMHDPRPPWFNYLIVFLLSPIALFITYKVFFRYKVINMGNGKIEIHYPQFRKKKTYQLKEVLSWCETVVKTGKNSSYKELEIKFKSGEKISMAWREYTEYEKMIQYLSQKLSQAKK